MANSSARSQAMDSSIVPPLSPVPTRQRSRGQRSERTDGKEFGLPDGWTVETRPRTNESYQRVVDRYFFEPETDKKFRSLKAAKRHLNLNPCIDDTSKNIRQPCGESNINEYRASPSSNQRAKRRIRGCEYFEFTDRPTSITLVSTAEKNELDPFLGDIRVDEKIKRFWEETFIAISGANDA